MDEFAPCDIRQCIALVGPAPPPGTWTAHQYTAFVKNFTSPAEPAGRPKSNIFNGCAGTTLLDLTAARTYTADKSLRLAAGYADRALAFQQDPLMMHTRFGRSSTWLGLALAVAAVILTTPDVDAQRATRERTVFASAVDDKGEPVAALGPDAFVIREDGVRREVLRVSPASEPIDIALLIDNSQASQDEVTFIREAVSGFVAQMATGNKIAVIGLAERPTPSLRRFRSSV
jgi:hypothetical protein